MTTLLKNPHPGDILQEEFMKPLGLTQTYIAESIGVVGNRISELVNGRRGITADTDLRLSRFFGLSPGYWLRLQNMYVIMEVKRDHEADIKSIQPHSIPNKEVFC